MKNRSGQLVAISLCVVLSACGLAGGGTEQKRIEDELAKHRDNLEELVAERTRELEQINKIKVAWK